MKADCTFLVTSCECERSFSILRRLKIWLRSSTITKLLSTLTKMNIHYCVEVDYEEVVRKILSNTSKKASLQQSVFRYGWVELYLLKYFTLGAKVYPEPTQHLS